MKTIYVIATDEQDVLESIFGVGDDIFIDEADALTQLANWGKSYKVFKVEIPVTITKVE